MFRCVVVVMMGVLFADDNVVCAHVNTVTNAWRHLDACDEKFLANHCMIQKLQTRPWRLSLHCTGTCVLLSPLPF